MTEINKALKFATYYDRTHRYNMTPFIRYDRNFKKFEKIIRKEKICNTLKYERYEKILKNKFVDTREVVIVIKQSKIFTPYWLLSDF